MYVIIKKTLRGLQKDVREDGRNENKNDNGDVITVRDQWNKQ